MYVVLTTFHHSGLSDAGSSSHVNVQFKPFAEKERSIDCLATTAPGREVCPSYYRLCILLLLTVIVRPIVLQFQRFRQEEGSLRSNNLHAEHSVHGEGLQLLPRPQPRSGAPV